MKLGPLLASARKLALRPRTRARTHPAPTAAMSSPPRRRHEGKCLQQQGNSSTVARPWPRSPLATCARSCVHGGSRAGHPLTSCTHSTTGLLASYGPTPTPSAPYPDGSAPGSAHGAQRMARPSPRPADNATRSTTASGPRRRTVPPSGRRYVPPPSRPAPMSRTPAPHARCCGPIPPLRPASWICGPRGSRHPAPPPGVTHDRHIPLSARTGTAPSRRENVRCRSQEPELRFPGTNRPGFSLRHPFPPAAAPAPMPATPSTLGPRPHARRSVLYEYLPQGGSARVAGCSPFSGGRQRVA